MLDSPKTVAMFEILDKGALIHYREQSLFHKNIPFKVLTENTENISQIPLVSIGASPLSREIISLDPRNSPLLAQKYAQFPGASLEELVHYIRTQVFTKDTSERLLNAFIFAWMEGHTPNDFTLTENLEYRPVIPLDDFIRSGVGVCRHSALVATYFIDRLIREHRLPPGRVRYVRDTIKFGGHAWVLYFPENSEDVWHIDPHLGAVVNCRTDLELLYLFYGREALDRQMERFK